MEGSREENSAGVERRWWSCSSHDRACPSSANGLWGIFDFDPSTTLSRAPPPSSESSIPSLSYLLTSEVRVLTKSNVKSP